MDPSDLVKTALTYIGGATAIAAPVYAFYTKAWVPVGAWWRRKRLTRASQLYLKAGFAAEQPIRRFVRPWLREVGFDRGDNTLWLTLALTNAQPEQVMVTFSGVQVAIPHVNITAPFSLPDMRLESCTSDTQIYRKVPLTPPDSQALLTALAARPLRVTVRGQWSARVDLGQPVNDGFTFEGWIE